MRRELLQIVREREECIQELKDELARLKGEKGKPKIKPSRLEPKEKAQKQEEDSQECPGEENKAHKKRPGSEKRHKTASLPIHETTQRKNRINFLELLRGQRKDYVLSSEALIYMAEHKLPQQQWQQLSLSLNRVFKDKEEWLTYLKGVGVEKDSHVKSATEGALLGAVLASGVSGELGIVSDGVGQFRLLEHGQDFNY